MAYAWGTLLRAVRTGAPAYHEVFGRPFWDDLEAHPDVATSFDALMGPAGHGTPDPEVLIDGAWVAVDPTFDHVPASPRLIRVSLAGAGRAIDMVPILGSAAIAPTDTVKRR